ncbi:unnamed protein product [Penicillium salamii]|uniref:Cysteine dioxygenase n=1 Tax=Penicillium salamii TaxID=1612424 RepID=A0A9W4NAX6_9EURO|nr:unnamed protein product [Penicillium salamii]CAG8041516.1 unnamed protein product [Penicillium salamii]CAG8341137.1 unnamed protein product [Penicillium salamii]CAG8341362.1 unnamed protein product [Penicillium salamii]CAG8343501.1 unnamed protein product [Penicillium salamii]
MPYLNNESEVPLGTEAGIDVFEKLVQDLSAALGPSSGLDSSDVDPMQIQLLMEKYTSNPDEWSSYALEDASRTYTRNLIDEGNGKSNLLILVWSPGKGSTIHDHANAHCVMKILKGRLQEDLYSWPNQKQIENGEKCPPQLTKQTIYGENQVTYMSDKLGLHRISNPDLNDFAVSLHLYTPPNAAIHGFCIYDERTGKARHIKQTNFYSHRGQRLDDGQK